MWKLVCLINLFIEQQNIYLVDLETGKASIAASCTLDSLVEKIVDIADITQVNNIELCSAPSYAASIANDIYIYAKTRYNNHDLIVEVVK